MLQSPLYYNTTRVIYSKSLCLGCKRLMVLTEWSWMSPPSIIPVGPFA